MRLSRIWNAMAVSTLCIFGMTLVVPPAHAADGGCSRSDGWIGGCAQAGASVGNGGVDLSADREVNTPGRQGSGSGNGRGGDGGEGSGDGEWDGLPDGVSRVPGEFPSTRAMHPLGRGRGRGARP